VEFENGKLLAYGKLQANPGCVILIMAWAFHEQGHRAEAAEAFDLAAVQARLLGEGQLEAFEVSTRFYEIGSAQGLADTNAYLGSR